MGVVLTSVANGDVMSSSIQRTNITTVRNWINGGIVQSDIAKGVLESRHFRRMDHFGAPNERSVGITGTMWSFANPDVPVLRQYVHVDAHGEQVWDDVAGWQIRCWFPLAGTIDIVCTLWAWPTGANDDPQDTQVLPEAYTAIDVRLATGATGIGHTQRRLYDSGYDRAAATDAGSYLYGARRFTLVHQESVSAGWRDVSLQAYVITQASRLNYGRTVVGAGQLHVEYYAK